MTAGRSAGTEQGQGRESSDCRNRAHHLCLIPDDCGCLCHNPEVLASAFGKVPSPSVPPARDVHNHTRFSNDGGPWSPCPDDCPARDSGRDECTCGADSLRGLAGHLPGCGTDSGRDEAREAVARWVFGYLLHNRPASDYDNWLSDNDRDMFRARADEILSLPAVAALLRNGA